MIKFLVWLLTVLGYRQFGLTVQLKENTMSIALIIGTVLALSAIEKDAHGDILTGEKFTFTSSDETVFTVAADENDPTKPVFTPVGVGSAVFSIFDESNTVLHNSYDVVVSAGPATEIDLLDANGNIIPPDAPVVAAAPVAPPPVAAVDPTAGETLPS